MKKRILIIAAHPDDEILGCGGTIAKLTRDGYEAYTLILGEGVTSRSERKDARKRLTEINSLKKQAIQANKAIGVKKVFTYDFPDNKFDTVPLLDIIKVIEKIKKGVNPHIIFTHYRGDLNIDHRIVYQAVITATRPLPSETVKEIYSFCVLSSTEWNYPLSFSPDVFFEISETLNYKLRAMRVYKSELRHYPHPRSLKGITLLAQWRGLQVGYQYAEAFQVIRVLR